MVLQLSKNELLLRRGDRDRRAPGRRIGPLRQPSHPQGRDTGLDCRRLATGGAWLPRTVAYGLSGVEYERRTVAHRAHGVAHDVRGVAHGAREVAYGRHEVAHGARGVGYERQGVGYELRKGAHGLRRVAYGLRGVGHGVCGVAHGALEVGYGARGAVRERTEVRQRPIDGALVALGPP